MTTKEEAELRNVYVAILAVVATMEELRKEGLPCIASSVYLAIEEKGLPGLTVLRIMEMSGVVTGSDVLRPGPKYAGIVKVLEEGVLK